MTPPAFPSALVLALVHLGLPCHAAEPSFRIYAPPVDMATADAALDQPSLQLASLPKGVEQVSFRDLYRFPVGPRGLEFSDRAKDLRGRRVRMLGFMVREDRPVPGRLLLSPFAFTLFTREYGLAEDLPPAVVHIYLTEGSRERVPFTPGLLLLTGTLELGNADEPDGRVSAVRIRLDPPPAAEAARAP